jgi:hypothetical protein
MKNFKWSRSKLADPTNWLLALAVASGRLQQTLKCFLDPIVNQIVNNILCDLGIVLQIMWKSCLIRTMGTKLSTSRNSVAHHVGTLFGKSMNSVANHVRSLFG